MAISISVLILVIGLISLFTLPVEQYPDIAPPTVYVSANYTGADAEAVLNSVIMPLEESINGVENMMYISSTATNAGSATIQVYFKQGTDPDMAAVNVQNRVSKAQGLLPAEVTKIGVNTQKRQTSFLQIGALVSTDGRYDQTFLANYLDINVIPQIKRIEGVGDVMELGDTYSMRIWLKPERMAQYGLVPSDVTAVLGEQNIEAPTGSLGENSKNVFQFTMKYRGRLKSVEEFQNTVVRSQSDGSVLRLKDVADVELGTLTYSFRSEMDSKPAVLFMMFQAAGSNATAVNKQITAQIERDEEEPAQRDGICDDDEFQRLPLRFHTQCGGDTGHCHHTGNSGGVFLPAGLQEYAYTLHFHYRVAGRHVCLPGGCGVQSQHLDAVCAGACHRYGGGRCHRGGGGGAVQVRCRIVLTLPRRMRWAM